MYIYTTYQNVNGDYLWVAAILILLKNVSYLVHWQKPTAIFQYPFSFYFIVMEPPILAGH